MELNVFSYSDEASLISPDDDASPTSSDTFRERLIGFFGMVERTRVALAIIVLLIAVVLFAGIFYGGETADCEKGWVAYDKKCFMVINESSFYDARSICTQRLHGELAAIHSSEENDFVYDLLRESNRGASDVGAWIGLTVPEGKNEWTWLDGSKFDFASWGPEGPRLFNVQNEACTILMAADPSMQRAWHARSCTLSLEQAAVCQKYM